MLNVFCKWNVLHHKYSKRNGVWDNQLQSPRVQFLQWLHSYFCPFSFVVVHRCHKRIPERLIRNGLSSLLVLQNFLTPWLPCCTSTLSYPSHWGQGARKWGPFMAEYQSHQKQQTHELIRTLNNVWAKSLEESISHSRIVSPLQQHRLAYHWANILYLDGLLIFIFS